MTSLKEKLIKIGAKVVSHGRYVAFQMAEAGEGNDVSKGRAYAAVEKIDWPDGFYRRDIGWRALLRG